MGTKVKATAEVKSWDEGPIDEEGPLKLTRADVRKTFSGDIDGESFSESVMSYAEDGTATFVGLERIRGTVAGRTGTLVLQSVGAFDGKAARAELTVVPGSGTGELASVAGRGTFLADPTPSVELDLDVG